MAEWQTQATVDRLPSGFRGSSPLRSTIFYMFEEKKQWYAYYWNPNSQQYEKSFPLTKSVAKLCLRDEPYSCHFIRKEHGWFQRQIENPDHSVFQTNIVAGGDVAGRDIVKSCNCPSH